MSYQFLCYTLQYLRAAHKQGFLDVRAVLRNGSDQPTICDGSTHSDVPGTFATVTHVLSPHSNEQYNCSGVFKAYTSSMCQLHHLLFTMLLARLSVCPCQVQVQSQLPAKLLRVTNVPCIDVRRSEDKANHDWLIGEAHIERSLSFDAIHARMQIFQLHVH